MRRDRRGLLLISVGWLFADMLLALAVLFLAANTNAPKLPVSLPPVRITVTQTRVQKQASSPTVNVLQIDETKRTLIITGNDPGKLKEGDGDAITYLETQIRKDIISQGLQNRRAAIAIAYGGAIDTPQAINQGVDDAKEVYHVLDELGREKFVFCGTKSYDPLFTFNQDPGTVVIDVFLFNASAGGCQ